MRRPLTAGPTARLLAAALLGGTLLGGTACGGKGGSGGPAPGFTRVISRQWSIPAGESNLYRCTRVLVTQDTWVAAIHAASPAGAHHAFLTSATESALAGDFDCEVGLLDPGHLFEAESGNGDLTLPDGVALKLAAGTTLVLKLHLVDGTGKGLSGTTTVDLKEVAPPDAAHRAELVYSGSINFSLPPFSNATVSGGCTLSADATLLTLWPHMHKYGVSQVVTLGPPAGAQRALLDAPFDFLEPLTSLLAPPVTASAGEVLTTTCTFTNGGNTTVVPGPAASDEACLTGFIRYPATGEAPFACLAP